ncbi:MAG: hypothetical protein KUG69_08460 [Marinosulfonomonas sp.]|nr:hypothetical protein [Marinosulfonomonas sp.]
MKPIQSALLFVSEPKLLLAGFCDALNSRLAQFGIELAELPDAADALVSLSGNGLQLAINFTPDALPAESFRGALETPLSAPFRGVLSDILFRHSRNLTLTVSTDEHSSDPIDRLGQLRIAHAATTILCERHIPAAVHWRQSNQLLVGGQYLRLSGEPTPWVLFAAARTRGIEAGATAISGDIDVDVETGGISLRLEEAAELIGRPIQYHHSTRPLGEIYAAALAFLRYATDTGKPIPDGHTFGPSQGSPTMVTHIEPSSDIPLGRYDLHAFDETDETTPHQAPAIPAVPQISPDLPSPYADPRTINTASHAEHKRSMTMSYLMLIVMPPIGLLMLIANTLFGANSWRTGVIAVASVALALFVAASTFLNYVGQETAVFIDPSPIVATTLTD